MHRYTDLGSSSMRFLSSSRFASLVRVWSEFMRGQCKGKLLCSIVHKQIATLQPCGHYTSISRGSKSGLLFNGMQLQCANVDECGVAVLQKRLLRQGSSVYCKRHKHVITFQCRLSVQNSQICMPHVQHSLVAGRLQTSHVTTS